MPLDEKIFAIGRFLGAFEWNKCYEFDCLMLLLELLLLGEYLDNRVQFGRSRMRTNFRWETWPSSYTYYTILYNYILILCRSLTLKRVCLCMFQSLSLFRDLSIYSKSWRNLQKTQSLQAHRNLLLVWKIKISADLSHNSVKSCMIIH